MRVIGRGTGHQDGESIQGAGRDFLSKVSAIIPASGPDAAIAFDDDRRGNT